jgi:hypothetical protein
VLEPLARKDLIGSAYAYAAFSRAAKAKVGLAGAAAFALANARHGWAAIAVVVPVLFFGRAQRAQWIHAVQRGAEVSATGKILRRS